MFTLNGILKKDEIKEITKKDGLIVKERIIYVGLKSSTYPLVINVDNHDLNLGKIGQGIALILKFAHFIFRVAN